MIKIITENCIGCGLCSSISPEAFIINNEGLAETTTLTNDETYKTLVLEAIDGCPTSAIIKE